MVRVIHDHHTLGTWSLKPDTVINPGIRNRTISTRILGIGIALAGVLVLGVGLIMGLEFPSYVRQQNHAKQCVLDSSHDNYQSWIHGTQWNRKVHVYYWILVNADDFLYEGQIPKKGPYVYTETESKQNLNFATTEVSFQKRHEYIFDQSMTSVACTACAEQDVLTIISPWYLQTVGQHGGEELLSWTYIPTYMTTYLKAAGFLYIQKGQTVFQQNISDLGKFVSDSSTVSTQPLRNFSFGAWLRLSTSEYRHTIQNRRDGQDFQLGEVQSLYQVFTNLTLLGGKALSQPDPALREQCKQWALGLCFPASPSVKMMVGRPECGIIYIFSQCRNNFSAEAWDVLQDTFCPPDDPNVCLNLTGLPDDLLLAYGSAIPDFLWHLSRLVLDSFLSAKDLSLVTSRNQSQLALGYDVDGDDVFPKFRVAGLLESSWIGNPAPASPVWNVYTCLEKKNMNNNLKVKAYNNSWHSPDGLLQSPVKVSLSAFTDFVSPCSSLVTCRTCPSPGHTLSFFMEDLLRATPFSLNSSTSMADVRLFRYQLQDNVFSKSSLLKTENGLQDMTDVVGYLSWASLPHVNERGQAVLVQDDVPSTSYVLVEPVTGKIWERSVKLQWNVGISDLTGHVLGRNISVTGLPLPVFWTDKMATISTDEIQTYKHLITRLMAVSCGGMIGFSVVSFLVIAAGIVVCVYPFKSNRITPSVEEPSNVSGSRHL